MRIAICAGEPSGDVLGAALIESLRERVPEAEFRGIAGPRMQAVGCETLMDMQRLSVMGLTEAVPRLVSLLPERRRLAARLAAWQPQVMVGVDAPDFNLGLEGLLRRRGVRTVHYVSPSVWAWRRYRVRRIRRDAGRVLALLPFEAEFFRAHDVPVSFVGHPLADALWPAPQRDASRRQLGVPLDASLVALLPGSRPSEIARIGPGLIASAAWLAQRRAGVQFVVPAAGAEARAAIAGVVNASAVPAVVREALHVVAGEAQAAMSAADVVLVASGTAALETMLVGRPMVVTYQVASFTWWLGRQLLKVPFVALPNLLAKRELVPEILQDEATPARLGGAVLSLLNAPRSERDALAEAFTELAATLRCDASARAADAVLEVARADVT